MSTQFLQRPLVIDDTDTRVRYTAGGWFKATESRDDVGTFGPPYNSTLHGTKTNGNVSFAFEGTSVKVFGSIDTTGERDTTAYMTWECFVDQESMGLNRLPSHTGALDNNMLLCGQDALRRGPHELTVAVSINGGTFWFDYLQYIPYDAHPGDEAVLFDNRDPDIVYDTSWHSWGGSANSTTKYNSTMKINFTGTQLSWFGIVSGQESTSSSGSYSIDGGSPISFQIGKASSRYSSASMMYNQLFFMTPNLSAGSHNLLVTHAGNGQTVPLTLDHLVIANGSAVKIPRKANVGAIVGGVAGTLAFLFILFAAFLLWRKRQHHSKFGLPHAPNAEVTPFISYPPTSLYPSTISSSASNTLESKRGLFPQLRVDTSMPIPFQEMHKDRHVPQASTSGASSSRSSFQPSADTRSPSSPVRTPIQHYDSGIRLSAIQVDEALGIEEIPPTYRET
ncbi:hypothetical protein FPV67DRAFT_1130900 [Lyophyllum atratum]|nr:hypothetical protein FPV67DRAFT_1130900 [Lyophyllum atratum]